MGKSVIIKFIIAVTVVCITHETRSDGTFSVSQANHINYICKNVHWKDMGFDEFHCEMGWIKTGNISSASEGFRLIDKLKTFPYMMGCAYGQKLFDFLWLTIHTGEVCKSLSPTPGADDCWRKLTARIEYGAFAVFQLLSTLELIQSLDTSITPSPYHETLSSIRSFLKTSSPRENFGDEEINGTRQTIILAHSLAVVLDSNCKPKPSFFEIDKLTDEFTKQNSISSLYDFYVDRLHFYTTYIIGHLLNLGFYYNAFTDKMELID